MSTWVPQIYSILILQVTHRRESILIDSTVCSILISIHSWTSHSLQSVQRRFCFEVKSGHKFLLLCFLRRIEEGINYIMAEVIICNMIVKTPWFKTWVILCRVWLIPVTEQNFLEVEYGGFALADWQNFRFSHWQLCFFYLQLHLVPL